MPRAWRFSGGALAAVLVLVWAIAVRAGGGQPPRACPETPVPAIAPQGLADVCIPDGFVDIPMEYFDDFSWRAFIALVWPASSERGRPAASKPLSASGPRVFETFKSLWEVFPEDGRDPVASFAAYDVAAHNPCGVQPAPDDLVIGSFSGIDDIGQAGNGALDGPIVAQNGRYVRTLTLYNQVAFDFIVSHKYYLRSRLPAVPMPRPETPVLEFPTGSVVLKSAWIDVAGLSPELVRRFYTRNAIVRRPGGNDCSRVTMGLVGLHIVQKTSSRPQWIWASFEQTDNVPPSRPDAPDHTFNFHDATNTRMPDRNPLRLVPLPPEPATPFNLARADQILTRTDLTSFAYQSLVPATPWRFYRLVMSQWPRLDGNQATPVPANQDGAVPHTFPGVAAFSSTTNITMETFDQHGPQLGCMNCHNRVRMTTDFMWTVFDHAYPSRLVASGAGAAE